MSQGWICVHRKLLEWEWFDDHNTFRLFMYFMLKANHKDKKWKGILIKRGQHLTSLDAISLGSGLTKSQVRTSIKKLKSTHEIAHESNKQHTVITVINYNLYQASDTQVSTQVTHESHTSDTQVTPNNNVNNENNVNTLSQSEIPVNDIVNIYNEVCTNMPEVKKVTSKQKRFIWIKARWNEDKDRQDLGWWKDYFKWCNQNDQLTGNEEGFDWVASLEDLVNASKMQRLIEKGRL